MATGDDGLIERLLFVYPDSEPQPLGDHRIPDQVRTDYSALIRALLDLTLDSDGKAGLVTLIPRAKQTFLECDAEHVALWRSPDTLPHMKGVFAKQRSYAARLTLILHCARYVSDEQGDGRTGSR